MDYEIGPMRDEDWAAVLAIYLEGIATRNATFETQAPSWEKWNVGHLKECRLVARNDEAIIGWAALSPVSSRRVYAGVTEVSVYVTDKAKGKGIGRALLEKLIEESEGRGIWTLQASIFPENQASIKLHERCGFRVVGRRERIAQLDGQWRDTILLERRSTKAGV
jgi:phosphinothricin acetyltransferase